ncbi:28S ribosomal protein S17, mitochondrial [Galendromus occidentalis]|uniref:28S ribosomal protein S17, mitochondrial n=1 Tax=Galendromus occidentalis TaxID=34638 RepID=A0AAJ6W0G5_9ACAR|nr:28S ribosomal protein S17, mitochondrial [Galendromus occidentalis]
MSVRSQLMLGKVITAAVNNSVKVQVTQYVLNKHLMCHFKERTDYEVLDEKLRTKLGDWVLLEKLPEKHSLTIDYKVKDIVWMMGNIIDPITGKKCVKTDFEEDLDREAELMGGKPFHQRLAEFRAKKAE